MSSTDEACEHCNGFHPTFDCLTGVTLWSKVRKCAECGTSSDLYNLVDYCKKCFPAWSTRLMDEPYKGDENNE